MVGKQIGLLVVEKVWRWGGIGEGVCCGVGDMFYLREWGVGGMESASDGGDGPLFTNSLRVLPCRAYPALAGYVHREMHSAFE